METSELIKSDSQVPSLNSPAQLLELAISKDLDIDKLRELMQLQREWQADRARESFFEALTQFQASAPELRKSKQVNFKDVHYTYATLGDITRQIRGPLKQAGISYRWEIDDKPEELKVTCLISHKGHTERTTMTAKPDVTGSKNAIQARGSTITYLQRYTLIGALGLSTADSDEDGQQPPVDMDKLHKEFMEVYNQLIQIDSSYTRYHPDSWKGERNGKNYVRAIAELRKELFKLQGDTE